MRVDALVKQEGDALLAYFARRVRPIEDAADLLSETFTVVWRRAESLPDDDEQGRMWLYGIARNVLTTHRRAQGRRSALTDRLRAELGTEEPSGSIDGTVARPGADALHAAELVRALPAPDKEIFMLLHWDGFTLAEIAGLLGLPAGTVRSRYSRARAALKEQLSVDTE